MDRDIKKECAKEALKLIKDNYIVGLGGGSTIAHLIKLIKESRLQNVKIVTPSSNTKYLCIEEGLEILHTSSVEYIDIAFDGCDQIDSNFHALKSGGGIHTKEKIVSNLAKEYVILVDESKFLIKLDYKVPVVLEIFEDAFSYVKKELNRFDISCSVRKSSAKDGFTITDNGNILLDLMFNSVDDSSWLENKLNSISGVIDCSIFTKSITKILVTGTNGTMTMNRK